MRRTIIYGAGGLGREVYGWLRHSGHRGAILFCADGEHDAVVHVCDGAVPILDPADLNKDYVHGIADTVLIAIADCAARERIAGELRDRAIPLDSFVHGSAALMPGLPIPAGVMMLPFALASDRARIGRGVIINAFSSLGHDASVGAFSTLSSYVCLAGGAQIGERVFIGTHVTVIPGVKIGNEAYIGAGSVVVRDVQAGARMFGNPARQIA